MLRSHILQRTHITITLNPLGVSSDVGESYVCVWRAYNYICDTTGSRYSCVVQGSYIHVCICVYLCVCMCETLCIFFLRCARIDLAWTRVTPSKRVTGVRVKFYTVVPNFRSPIATSSIHTGYMYSPSLFRNLFILPLTS